MPRTLYAYLTRDLIKVTLLTLVAITLLMTVLAIIQPLRKLGLAGAQVLSLFVFTMPVMVSFTLPVATLFATALVYGRFSQDRELLACRASGLSTLALLRPALVLGALVTVSSLLLSNFIAPNLSTLAGVAQSNVPGILYHRLKTRGYVSVGRAGKKHIVHADRVEPENDTLHGVVYAYLQEPAPPRHPGEAPRPRGMFLASASAAYLDFRMSDPNRRDRVVIQPVEPSIIQTGEMVAPPIAPTARTMRLVMPLPNPIAEKPSWYSWPDLQRRLDNPMLSAKVRREIARIKQAIRSDVLARDIVDAIGAGKSYDQLSQGDEIFRIVADEATVDADGAAVLRGVTVTILRRSRLAEQITADNGRVVVASAAEAERPQVTIKLSENVAITFHGPAGRRQTRDVQWARGEIPVPEAIRTAAAAIDPRELCREPARFTPNEKILRAVRHVTGYIIPRMRSALVAEQHGRVAYGVSCFLMVAMGAALGVIFRGGQFISAFVTSVVPASLVVFLLMMGKTMVQNPDVPAVVGLACIWGAIVALFAADAAIYALLARR